MKLTEPEALKLFATSIREIVGPRSEAYRDLTRALETGQAMDMILAQSSFDALPYDTRLEIAERVEALVAEHLSGTDGLADTA